MSQVFDSKKNLSPSLYWDDLRLIADMLLHDDLKGWLSEHDLDGVDVKLFNSVSSMLESVLSVGLLYGPARYIDHQPTSGKLYALNFYGQADELLCQALVESVLPKLQWIQSMHDKFLAANAFSLSPVIMWQAAEINDRWVLTQANDALSEYLGVDKGLFIGKNAERLIIDFIHPDDVPKLMIAYDITRTTSQQMTLQYRLRNANGDYVPVTERVKYSVDKEIKQSLSVVWHRELDQIASDQQYRIFRDIEKFSQDVSLETGRTFLDRFCRNLASVDLLDSIVLLAKTRGNWWESWMQLQSGINGADFHIDVADSVDLSKSPWNRQNLLVADPGLKPYLFASCAYQSIVPLVFDGEVVEAVLLLGSSTPLKNREAIEQLIRIFGVRIVREINQLRIADAQSEQNQLLSRQKLQLTNMITLLGQLDAVAGEYEFLQTMTHHLREAFDLKCLDWVFWESGEWRYVSQLASADQPAWYQPSQPILKEYWLRYLEQSRRSGELVLYRGRLRAFWPLGQSEAGYLVAVLTFHANFPDTELLHFTQNALALAKQGLIQRETLRFQAMHDSLTGLGNRMQLHAWVKAMLPSQDKASLILFDLNRFKEINDSFGHQFGDKLLREIGPRISGYLAEQAHFLARLGGDEFALFFPDIAPEDAFQIAVELNEELAKSYLIEGLRFQVEASVGVAHYPLHGLDGHELLRCADVAMYQAKTSNRAVVQFNTELDNSTPLRIAVLSELDTALLDGQLWVAYQPLMSTATGQAGGVEALVRWTHPEFGPLSPADFIPIAEMGEGIRKITDFVLHKTMAYLQTWRKIMPELHVAVNISPRVLLNHQFPENIAHMLSEYKLPGDAIIMELTESTLLVDPVRAVEIIHQLSKLGVNVEIDDFGTGYSSLSYLKSLPITALKIDRSFVTDILQDSQNEVIVQSTVQMAHNLGLLTVAEGVEDEATLLKMMRLGCDLIQGYYYAKPIHGRDVADWLKRNV